MIKVRKHIKGTVNLDIEFYIDIQSPPTKSWKEIKTQTLPSEPFLCNKPSSAQAQQEAIHQLFKKKWTMTKETQNRNQNNGKHKDF